MKANLITTPYDALTYHITGCAMAVHRELGPGLRENSYQSGCPIGLLINFGERSLNHRRILPPKNVAEVLINRQWLFVPDWLQSGQ